MFQENVDTAVGDGLGFRAGLGQQVTDYFGFEAILDVAPALDPTSLLVAI